jgi:hypothetical protein
MIHPTDNQRSFPHAAPARAGSPVTCVACGCRLEGGEDGTWRHFNPLAGRDARGCLVLCADLVHGSDGTAVAVATA